jgi:hypothetical protein
MTSGGRAGARRARAAGEGEGFRERAGARRFVDFLGVVNGYLARRSALQ